MLQGRYSLPDWVETTTASLPQGVEPGKRSLMGQSLEGCNHNDRHVCRGKRGDATTSKSRWTRRVYEIGSHNHNQRSSSPATAGQKARRRFRTSLLRYRIEKIYDLRHLTERLQRASGKLHSVFPTSQAQSVATVMFKITTRPPKSSPSFPDETPSTHRRKHRRHPIEIDAMDLDRDDLGEGPSSLRRTVVSPGEVITSSKEYMRSVSGFTYLCESRRG